MLRFTAADGATPPHIVRDFQDPYLELVRLVREASEIEHALLVQYLYASFSVKSRYQAVIGTGGGDSISLVGVAVQEMHHLARVNELLTDLHAAPNLVRQDFPYEPDIYPFELSMEPLSRRSCANTSTPRQTPRCSTPTTRTTPTPRTRTTSRLCSAPWVAGRGPTTSAASTATFWIGSTTSTRQACPACPI